MGVFKWDMLLCLCVDGGCIGCYNETHQLLHSAGGWGWRATQNCLSALPGRSKAGGGVRERRGGVVSAWGEAALPDPVPRHRRGWGRGAPPFSLGFSELLALHLKTLPAPAVLLVGTRGLLLLSVQFVPCSKMALQLHFERVSAGFKCSSGEKIKIQKGGKKERRPPSTINYLWGWSSAGWCNRCI